MRECVGAQQQSHHHGFVWLSVSIPVVPVERADSTEPTFVGVAPPDHARAPRT